MPLATGSNDPGSFFARYAWVIARNAVGWLLIFTAILVGGLFPIPLGTPMFLVGFAMVAFPGKRRLTANVLRGIPIKMQTRNARIVRAFLALLLPALAIWVLSRRSQPSFFSQTRVSTIIAIYCASIAAIWIAMFWFIRLLNLILTWMPAVRRRVRPWLKRRGLKIKATPFTRGKALMPDPPIESGSASNSPGGGRRFPGRPGKSIIFVLFLAAIIGWMFKPVRHYWRDVHQRVMETSLQRLLIAALMFAVFLFVFRVLSWRKIIACFGFKLPLATSARIWSLSELARYLPGVIWQVWGRVYLVRPYGVNAIACSASQMLELAIFLMANILVVLACLPWFAANLTGRAHFSFWLALAVAPVLLLLLIPRVFYGIINSVMRRLKKPPIQKRLHAKVLFALLGWAVLGLCWQGVAIWLLLSQPHALGLAPGDLPLVIGAYCLAWCAGFLMVTAPGGIGVREVVLVGALRFALPAHVRQQFSNAENENVVLFFLAVLLRLWTIAGELTLSTVAHLLDYRGALGRADAPGRMPLIIAPLRIASPAASCSVAVKGSSAASLSAGALAAPMPAGVAGDTQ